MIGTSNLSPRIACDEVIAVGQEISTNGAIQIDSMAQVLELQPCEAAEMLGALVCIYL